MPSTRLPSAIAVAVLSLLSVFLYSRAGILYSFYANAPSRLERIDNLRNLDIKFRNIVRNCEDAVLDADQGFALLSCDPGRDTWNTVMGTFVDPKSPNDTGLYFWNYADESSSSHPEKLKLLDFTSGLSHFHPLGVDYHAASNTLFVVNHAPTGPCIEMFKLFLSEKAATHTGTIKHDLIAAPNAVAAVSGHELFVTNDHYFLAKNNPTLALLETYLGIPGGSVVHVDLHSILHPKVSLLARVPFANGIIELNSTALAVASSSMNSVYIYRLERPSMGESPRLKHIETVSVPFHADNLSVDKNGKLLVSGHPHGPTLEKVAKNSARCDAPGSENKDGCEKGLSWIAEWSEEDGVRTLYVGDGFGTSSTAVRDVERKIGIATGLYERGVLTWND